MRHGWLGRRPKLAYSPRIDGLEPRLVLSTVAPPPVSVAQAHTADSKTVTFDYDVNTPSLPDVLNFGVYRSADPWLDAGDVPLTSVSIATTAVGRSTLDQDGQPAAAVGHHSLGVEVPGGLTIEPDLPFVLVVASPETAIGASDLAARTGLIHIHTIAVVTHGGIQSPSDDVAGPLWQRQAAKELTAQGYDSVVKFVWSKPSRSPGSANEQAPKLGRMLNRVAAGYPEGDPVDIHFIGHSEGAVVNSRAAQLLQAKEAPGIAAGYIKMTMLDPHAANNSAPGYQYSTQNSFAGRIAKDVIRFYQWQAEDPIARVPQNVDSAEVFWQHTSVDAARTNDGLYNLWGQVPVIGNATYYDLTGPGISHGGDFSVAQWYRFNVIPTLGTGGHFTDPTILTGNRVLAEGDRSTKWYSTTDTARPQFQGTAAPGADLTLFAARNGSFGWKRVAETKVDASGHWQAASRALQTGRYRFVARSGVQAFPGRPGVAITPRLRLGSVTVHAPKSSHRV